MNIPAGCEVYRQAPHYGLNTYRAEPFEIDGIKYQEPCVTEGGQVIRPMFSVHEYHDVGSWSSTCYTQPLSEADLDRWVKTGEIPHKEAA